MAIFISCLTCLSLVPGTQDGPLSNRNAGIFQGQVTPESTLDRAGWCAEGGSVAITQCLCSVQKTGNYWQEVFVCFLNLNRGTYSLIWKGMVRKKFGPTGTHQIREPIITKLSIYLNDINYSLSSCVSSFYLQKGFWNFRKGKGFFNNWLNL